MMASIRFSDEEAKKIDEYAANLKVSRGEAIYRLVMHGVNEPTSEGNSLFKFKKDYKYFAKDHVYSGIKNNEIAVLKFSGQYMIFDIHELPMEEVYG